MSGGCDAPGTARSAGTLRLEVPAASVSVALDRQATGPGYASGTRTLAIDTTAFSNEPHDLLIRTTDAAGNRQYFLWAFRIENAVVTPTPRLTVAAISGS